MVPACACLRCLTRVFRVRVWNAIVIQAMSEAGWQVGSRLVSQPCNRQQFGRPPGTLVKLSGKEVPIFFRAKLSPHQVSICDVLASLEFAGDLPGEIVLIGIEPESLELGTDLTPTVAARIPEMVRMAAAELAAFGIPVQPRLHEVA